MPNDQVQYNFEENAWRTRRLLYAWPCEVYSPRMQWLRVAQNGSWPAVSIYRGLDYTITVSLEALIGPWVTPRLQLRCIMYTDSHTTASAQDQRNREKSGASG